MNPEDPKGPRDQRGAHTSRGRQFVRRLRLKENSDPTSWRLFAPLFCFTLKIVRHGDHWVSIIHGGRRGRWGAGGTPRPMVLLPTLHQGRTPSSVYGYMLPRLGLPPASSGRSRNETGEGIGIYYPSHNLSNMARKQSGNEAVLPRQRARLRLLRF